MGKKLDWIGSGAFHDLIAARKEGKSLKDIVPIIAEKYGITFTVARLSQVLKSLRDTEANSIGH